MSKPPAQRICSACRKLAPKRELLRLVRTSDRQVLFDPDHQTDGRGYHFHTDCADKALVPGKVSHFLGVDNTPELKKLLSKTLEPLA